MIDNTRPSDKSACNRNFIFYFSIKTYVVGTQKNRLNESARRRF